MRTNFIVSKYTFSSKVSEPHRQNKITGGLDFRRIATKTFLWFFKKAAILILNLTLQRPSYLRNGNIIQSKVNKTYYEIHFVSYGLASGKALAIPPYYKLPHKPLIINADVNKNLQPTRFSQRGDGET